MPPVVHAETRGDDPRSDHDTLQSLDESATKKDDDAKFQHPVRGFVSVCFSAVHTTLRVHFQLMILAEA